MRPFLASSLTRSPVASYANLMLRLALRLGPHPIRAARAVRAGWRFRARDWLRHPPFLPLPPREYLEWRLFTAYGSDRAPDAREVERYLRWVRRMHAGRERE